MGQEKNNITNDELAIMIKAGFDEVHEKLSGLDNKFNNMQDDMKEIKTKLEGVVYRFEYHELMNRLETVERHLGLKK